MVTRQYMKEITKHVQKNKKKIDLMRNTGISVWYNLYNR